MQSVVEGLGLTGGRLMFLAYVARSGPSKSDMVIQNTIEAFLMDRQEAMDRWVVQNKSLFERAQVVPANQVLSQYTGILIWNMIDANTNQKYHLIVPPVPGGLVTPSVEPESFSEEAVDQ